MLNKNGIKVWLTIVSSIAVPGSGYVYLGMAQRGLTMLLWMLAFGYITYQVTPPSLYFTARIGGGILIWILSVLDVERKAKRHWLHK